MNNATFQIESTEAAIEVAALGAEQTIETSALRFTDLNVVGGGINYVW